MIAAQPPRTTPGPMASESAPSPLLVNNNGAVYTTVTSA